MSRELKEIKEKINKLKDISKRMTYYLDEIQMYMPEEEKAEVIKFPVKRDKQ